MLRLRTLFVVGLGAAGVWAHAAGPASPTPASPAALPSPATSTGPVILFLVDNSASLPPLDPGEQRVTALEKVFGFLKGQRYRLVLFGGRQEISIDDPSKYSSTGQWTDFFAAFDTARELIAGYPVGTEFRLVLLTDGLSDPNPRDWLDKGMPADTELKTFVAARTIELVRSLHSPLYVILVGDLPHEPDISDDTEHSPRLVLELVAAANGSLAAPRAQKMAAFLKEDGALLKKFIYRVEPHEGLKRIEPVVRRIIAPAGARMEFQLLTAAVVPLILFVLLLIGVLVRAFPGPGDAEIIDLSDDAPLQVAVDKLHKLESGGWGNTGLSLVAEIKDAAASLSCVAPSLDLSGMGLDVGPLDATGLKLVQMSADEMRRTLAELASNGTKEEKIYALNLEYMARNMSATEAERILTTPIVERRSLMALDFLRAKAHIVGNPELRRKLIEPRVHLVGYGRSAERRDLYPGTRARIGPYGFVVKDVTKGGRRDIRIVLLYERVPSLLGLKNWVPDGIQRVARFRRSSHRLVN